jgi:hypothetical protein
MTDRPQPSPIFAILAAQHPANAATRSKQPPREPGAVEPISILKGRCRTKTAMGITHSRTWIRQTAMNWRPPQ